MAFSDKKDIKVTVSDALEFEPLTSEPPKKGRGLRFALVLILAGGSVGAWTIYGDRLDQLWAGDEPEVPLIKAPSGPVKVRPENPGGLRVPDRDKLVYDRMQGATSGGDSQGEGAIRRRGPERLLPPPEQPLPKPGALKKPEKLVQKPTPEPQSKPQPKTKPIFKPVAKVPTLKDVKTAIAPPPPPPPPLAPKSDVPASKPKPAPTPVAAPVAAPKAVPQKAVEAKPAPKPVAPKPAPILQNRVFLVQLAAARSQQGARDEWLRLRTKNLDLLGNLGLTVTKADLGPDRGIFYRLRAGPLNDEAAARSLCKKLTERKTGCLIIKPGQ